MTGAAERLRQLADAAGYENVTEFARAANVQEGTMRQHIARDSIPKSAALKYLVKAKKTGATVGWLLFGEGRGPKGLTPEDKALVRSTTDITSDNVVVYQLDIQGSAGLGASGEVTITVDNHRESIVGTYSFPRTGFKQIFGADSDRIVMSEVRGDSMIPTLFPGQIVMTNTADRSPSPPGLFYVWDGLGLVIKRVEFIAGSNPPTVRISSDNTRYSTYERTLQEAHICGRIITGFTRF